MPEGINVPFNLIYEMQESFASGNGLLKTPIPPKKSVGNRQSVSSIEFYSSGSLSCLLF